MGSVSDGTALDMFKIVYGEGRDLIPLDQHLAKDIPFSQRQKVGEQYTEAMVLTAETGFTLSGTNDAFVINPARAGVVRESRVVPYVTVLPSIVPWSIITRSAGAGQKAFFDATKFIVKNNLKSHEHLQEILRLYGRAASLLGYVSYATAGTSYRGVTYSGFGDIILNGITFTGGVNTTTKNILLAPGSFASGIWVGFNGVRVNEVNSSNVVVATGTLVSVNSELGYITVDFTPVAATSATSHRLCFDGMQTDSSYFGIEYILETQGSLFGIDNNLYSLWQGTTTSLGGTAPLTFDALSLSIANAVNASGADGDYVVYVNPRTWSTLNTDLAALRLIDSSYSTQMMENGSVGIKYFTQTGAIKIVAHRCVKEGDAFALQLNTWSRSGSSEVTFQIPGMAQPIIFPLENQAGYMFRSFSDQYIFCHAPARSVYISGINDEATA